MIKMNTKKIRNFKVIFITFVLITLVFVGCSAQEQETNNFQEKSSLVFQTDEPSVLPNWTDDQYHDYYATREKLINFNDQFQDLVYVFSVGKSVLNRDIWCIRITNEKNNSHKFSCLYDGCIHGNEWEGAEACLYFAEYILINFGKNQSITDVLNKSEIYIIPIVNPDGRQRDDRFDYNGMDLNRNFDVYFGRILGGSMPFGRWFPIKWIYVPFQPYIFTKSGRYPFSEPESQALRDIMKELRLHDFSFYLSLHTATHVFGGPFNNIKRQEYEISPRELNVIDSAKIWVENNTEYRSANDDRERYGFGCSVSYCFKECHVPSFCFEVLNSDYEPMFWHGKHDHLVHWMNTTLPVFMYLLVNIENFHDWNTPDIQPLLPEGVPPPPLEPLLKT